MKKGASFSTQVLGGQREIIITEKVAAGRSFPDTGPTTATSWGVYEKINLDDNKF